MTFQAVRQTFAKIAKNKELQVFLLGILITTPFLFSLFKSPHQINAHDLQDEGRILQFHKVIKEGDLTPRWAPDYWFGAGSPMFNFYQPLFCYLAQIPMFLDLNIIWSAKLIIAFSIYLSFLSMYLLAKEFFGRKGGILAATLFVYAPYHILEVYVRSADTENLALAFIPLILYLSYKLIKKPGINHFALLSISYACLILSHNIIALMVSGFLVIWIAFWILQKVRVEKDLNGLDGQTDQSGPERHHLDRLDRFDRLDHLLINTIKQTNPKRLAKQTVITASSLLLGLGLSAFFWLPAIVEKQYVHVEDRLTNPENYFNYTNHFLHPLQWFSVKWGYGLSKAGIDDDLGLGLGIIAITLATAVAVYLGIKVYKKKLRLAKIQSILTISTICLLIALLFTITPSKFIWDRIKTLQLFQFSWRFYTVGIIFLILIATYITKIIRSRILIGAIVIITVAIGFCRAKSKNYIAFTNNNEDYEPVNWIVRQIEQDIEERNVINVENLHMTTDPDYLPLTADKNTLGSEVEIKVDNITDCIKRDKPCSEQVIYPLVDPMEQSLDHEILESKTREHKIRIRAKEEQLIRVNLFYFPGWEAYIIRNNKREEITIKHDNALGFMDIKVPKGESFLEIVYQNTYIRSTAEKITLASLITLSIAYIIKIFYRLGHVITLRKSIISLLSRKLLPKLR